MILSTNVIDKEHDENDSSSDSSIKDEGLAELKNKNKGPRLVLMRKDEKNERNV